MTPTETGLCRLVGLLWSLQILMAVSLAHHLKNAQKMFDERVKVHRHRRQNHQKFKTKDFLFAGGGGG